MDSQNNDNQELQATLNALNKVQAVIWFKPDGTILEANENFCKALGYRTDEIVGRHHRIFVDRNYANSSDYTAFWRNLADGKDVVGEFTRYSKDHKPVNIVASYNAIRNGEGVVSKVVKFAIDVTQQRQKVDQLIAGIEETSGVIAGDAAAIASSSEELFKRSENQAATVEQTSAAMAEVSATVTSNVKNAEVATSEAKSAKEQAEKGAEVVNDAIQAMQKIEDGSMQIRKFIEVIDSIAFQTNLLALNAGVEAARAGEAGRGFAVVASEVRSLAQRASESAKDINQLIDSSGREVAEGAKLVNKTGEVLSEIMEGVTKVSNGIESIFEASREQASGIQEINNSISEIDKTTQLNATLAEESAQASGNLVKSSKDLIRLVGGTDPASQTRKPAQPKAPTPRKPASSRPAPVAPPAETQKIAVNQSPASFDDDEAWTEF